MEGGENLILKDKYDLHRAPEVSSAAERTRTRTGEIVPQDPASQITNYLDRFHEITGRTDPADREHGINAAKRLLHRKFVIKPDEIPQSYFANQRRLAREQGHGDIEITQEMKDQLTEVIIADQQSSLDKWVDYLSSPDAQSAYPDAARYWVLREVLQLSTYDKSNKRFRSRLDDEGKTSPFPDLNREALGVAISMVVKRVENLPEYNKLETQLRQVKNRIKALSGQLRKGDGSAQGELEAYQELLTRLRSDEDALLGLDTLFIPNGEETEEQIKEKLDRRSQIYQQAEVANFAKLYAFAIEQVTPASPEQLSDTRGEWIKYSQNSDPLPLVRSLQGHGTGWCTAGESTAAAQLQAGDFYVFYSHDSKGEPTIPRVAIRMEQDRITEVRGIAAEQNLDGAITPVVDEKLKEFPDGQSYQKKVSDMRRLTDIENREKEGQDLTAQDLTFLYEIDSPIEGFGYQKDPRIAELRSQRDPTADMPIVFDCEPTQIARNPREINERTKAYVGLLEPGMFALIQRFKIEHVYTSFPEGRIRLDTVIIGGKSEKELERQLQEEEINISDYARDMMRSKDFITASDPQNLNLVRLKVGDLEFGGKHPTTEEVFKRAKELGLELCPPEVGPAYTLQYKDQPMDGWVSIGMKPITDSRGDPRVFHLGRGARGLWLYDHWAFPEDRWRQEDGFVFSLPQRTENHTPGV